MNKKTVVVVGDEVVIKPDFWDNRNSYEWALPGMTGTVRSVMEDGYALVTIKGHSEEFFATPWEMGFACDKFWMQEVEDAKIERVMLE